ncbi:MAG TPA: RDD family protein, partial [Chitinophagaceae bacterium]|nr:RDD family protein [Chitinophagaceae bacterium]
PQNVEIEYGLASLGKRMLALGVDLGLMFCYIILLYYVLFKIGMGGFVKDNYAFMGLYSLLFLPVMLYHFVLESYFGGQTVGKKLLKIKVVRMDGGRATIYEYFIRWVLNLVDIWMLSGVIGLLSIILSKKSQRLGDMAAGTTVINLQAKITLQQTIYENLVDTYQPTFSPYELEALSDKDVNIIKKHFQNAQRKGDQRIIHRLAMKIKEVTGMEKTDLADEQLVAIVLKDHYHYHKDVSSTNFKK